jgi:hypothetical protein
MTAAAVAHLLCPAASLLDVHAAAYLSAKENAFAGPYILIMESTSARVSLRFIGPAHVIEAFPPQTLGKAPILRNSLLKFEQWLFSRG